MAKRRGRPAGAEAAEGVVYGVHPVEEALQMAVRGGVQRGATLVLGAGRRGPEVDALRDQAEAHGVRVEVLSADELDRLTGGGNHQSVALRLGRYRYAALEDILEACVADEHARVLVLDQVQDPHNLGALLRSAAAFGVAGVVLPDARSAPVSAVALRTSAGAAYHVAVARVTNLARALDQLREAGVWLYGAAGEAAATPAQLDWARRVGIVLGAEGSGLRRLTRERCDALVRIPHRAAVESLNVAVAGGILLYEAGRALGTPSGGTKIPGP